MHYEVAVNDIEPGNWVAWVLSLDGCFSRGGTHDDAVEGVPDAVAAYYRWLKDHDPEFITPDEAAEFTVAEDIRSRVLPNGYYANAFFDDDRKLLTADDAARVGRLLSYTRQDLMSVIRRISPEQMDRPIEAEVRGCIRKVIRHIASAEWWYWDRLELAFDWQDMPSDTLSSLEKSRAHTLAHLPELVGDKRIVEKRSEMWSARKLARRALWHEIVHTRQIERYLRAMN
jgi:predicted RNase H-like HicB family nuclease